MNGIQQIVHPGGNNNHAFNGQGCQHCNHHARQIDPSVVADQFLSEYYRSVSNNGWNASTYLFDHDCTVICRDKHVGNAHDLINYLSTEYIKRANYADLRSKWVVTSNDTMVINVFGHIQLVTFSGYNHCTSAFTETFILKGDQNGTIKCTHHMIDF